MTGWGMYNGKVCMFAYVCIQRTGGLKITHADPRKGIDRMTGPISVISGARLSTSVTCRKAETPLPTLVNMVNMISGGNQHNHPQGSRTTNRSVMEKVISTCSPCMPCDLNYR